MLQTLGFVIGISLVLLMGHKMIKMEEKRKIIHLSSNKPGCRMCFRNERQCSKEDCNYRKFRKLLNILRTSRESLDICVCLLTLQLLVNDILMLFEKGVRVRIIVDSVMTIEGNGGEECRSHLVRAGVPLVAIDNGCESMHHKFAVIDETFLVVATMNWTLSAFSNNYEHIEITNELSAVTAFSKEFTSIWSKYNNT